MLEKDDIATKQPYAHSLLAHVLFHSPVQCVYVQMPNLFVIVSWKPIPDLFPWFVYNTVLDRWSDPLYDEEDELVSFEWQRFLHSTMDRMDRFILHKWLEDAKMLNPSDPASILSPRVASTLAMLNQPTAIWSTAQAILFTQQGKGTIRS